MAVTVNIDSQIVVKTAAQWAADSTVYSSQRILVTSDVTYTNSDQRKFKIADGVQTWSNLDYMPIDTGANGVRSIYQDFTVSSALTGTTSITLINSALIPANTITVGKTIQILVRALRSTTSGNGSNYLYFNTSASLSGATQIGIQTFAGRMYSMQRQLWVRSSTESETINSSTSISQSDPSAATSNVAWAILNIDWTANVYIIQAFANAANGDSTTSRGMAITII